MEQFGQNGVLVPVGEEEIGQNGALVSVGEGRIGQNGVLVLVGESRNGEIGALVPVGESYSCFGGVFLKVAAGALSVMILFCVMRGFKDRLFVIDDSI